MAIAETRSTRSVKLAHNILTRAIDLARLHRKVSRNVSDQVTRYRPEGAASGRPSKAMTLDVALQLIRRCMAELDGTATGSPVVAAYTVLSWTTASAPRKLGRPTPTQQVWSQERG